jgi:hypothetical protein
MRVVVLAHPRSGTGYAAHCFRSVGWDVQHEQAGSAGISSWMWAVDSPQVPWGLPRNGYALDGVETLLHVMREPAAAICSIAYVEQASEPWRRQWIEIPLECNAFERAIWSYYGWQALIDANKPTRRAQLEQIERVVGEITGRDPIFMIAETPSKRRGINSRSHPTFPLGQLSHMAFKYKKTHKMLRSLCDRYEEMRIQ